ncbi:hypothetical protein RN70_00550 [Staphylococcus schleiferi]|uniref:hypothetical protein n=2 Tax=Staphylococcus coagulans TaxID=74706 RepID=UPI00067A06DB|nr:hypothetical protein [Staphylococcus coagulans]AKS68142.1 hypothetical protein NP71_00490 [Staphylococcus schleiferi]AKS70371.1 hypothetical protein OA96_00380 [Staphylococcus schleiferi]AKS72521.1 hypothetical protein RN70_00550 [Staphylococcus schleiferi]MBA8764315.1 hypothetical protein [Staphylococcus coagulans]MBT2809775.1 hypothetical protein [Staphylococcus coagulans]
MRARMKVMWMPLCCIVLLMGCSHNQTESKSDTKNKATTEVQQNNTSSPRFSDEKKKRIKAQVIQKLSKMAKEDGRAVSNRYFSTSSISTGDWYAMIDQGTIQINDTGKPGRQHFDFHTVTGAVVYTSKNKKTGFDASASALSNIEGYDKVADLSQPVTKYIFTEEGQVYEYTFKNGKDVTLSSGFAPKDHNDKDPNLAPNEQFKRTQNKALSAFYQRCLQK